MTAPVAFVFGGRMLVFAVIAPLSSLLVLLVEHVRGRRAGRRALADYRRGVERCHDALAAALAREESERRRAAPGPEELLRAVRTPATPLWQRRPGDEDFGQVRIGVADLPARVTVTGVPPPAHVQMTPPDLPVARRVPALVRLGQVKTLGVVGPREAVLGAARSLAVQLATLHPPTDLRISVTAASAVAADWHWMRWLPHVRNGRDVFPEASASLRARTTIEGSAGPGGQAVATATAEPTFPHATKPAVAVVFLDAVPGGGGRWARDEPAASAEPTCEKGQPAETAETPPTYVVALATRPGELPQDCTVVVTLEPGRPTHANLFVDGAEPIEAIRADLLPFGAAVLCARMLAPFYPRLARSPAPASTGGSRGLGAGSHPRARRAADAESLPNPVRLADLIGRPGGIDEATVAARWDAPQIGLVAAVGVAAGGPYSIDLNRDGPHMLVAGTTGSGKSELLRTLVASLAASAPPDVVTFMLVDYKGGAAFAECGNFPHTVAVLTDLDGRATERALASLDAELRRRERLLKLAKVSHLTAYRRLRAGRIGERRQWASDDLGSPSPERDPRDARMAADDPPEDLPAVPHLVIVIDEFATLVEELPDFVTGLVSVARRGRSLGIHLVLATQRPAGVVSAEIKANMSLRICMRVADPGESADIIGTADAALIPVDAAGEAIARVGSHQPVWFRAALCSGYEQPATETRVVVRPMTWLRQTSRPEQSTAGPAGTGSKPAAEQPRTDLQLLVHSLRSVMARRDAEAPAPPWRPPLPTAITVRDLQAEPDASRLPVGLVDLPHEQRHGNLIVDLAAGVHWLVAGAPRTGKTTLFHTLVNQLSHRLSPAEAHCYVVDSVAGNLRVLERIEHCGTVVSSADPSLVDRLLARLAAEVDCRRKDGMMAPRMLLLIDDWPSFAEASDQAAGRPSTTLRRLLKDGPSAGLTVVIGGDRDLLVSRVVSLVSRRIVLALADPTERVLAGLPAGSRRVGPGLVAGGDTPPGRGELVPGGHEVQLALPAPPAPVQGSTKSGEESPTKAQPAFATASGAFASGPARPPGAGGPRYETRPSESSPPSPPEIAGVTSRTAATSAAIGAATRTVPTPAARRGPIRIVPLPRSTSIEVLAAGSPAGGSRPSWLLLGAGGDEAGALGIDLPACGRLLFIGGPPGTGRSTAIRAVGSWARRRGLAVMSIDPVADTAGHSREPRSRADFGGVRIDPNADSLPAVPEPPAPRDLGEVVEGTPRVEGQAPAGETGGEPHVLLVCDDAEVLLGSAAEGAICDVLHRPPPRLAGVVLAGSAEAYAASFRPLAMAVRHGRATVLLGPPARTDVELVGRRVDRDAHPPPGRGVLVLNRGETPIQIAKP